MLMKSVVSEAASLFLMCVLDTVSSQAVKNHTQFLIPPLELLLMMNILDLV